jgi:hypothetical protein
MLPLDVRFALGSALLGGTRFCSSFATMIQTAPAQGHASWYYVRDRHDG